MELVMAAVLARAPVAMLVVEILLTLPLQIRV
jgi:hypothetical protein